MTSAITMAAATAIVRRHDRNLLAENGGSINITKTWAKSLLHRMGYVKRRGSSTAKMIITDLKQLKNSFCLTIRPLLKWKRSLLS